MSLQAFIDNFAKLADARNGVPKLCELILQLAVEGKLVPQNPNDEPASTLLARITAERNRKAQRNGDRTVRELPSISPVAMPFDLPAGWTWERLGNIGETNIGLTYSPKDIASTGIPVLRSNNIKNGKLNLSDLVRVDLSPKPSVMVDAGDLLICARNGSRALVGKAALIDNLSERTAFGAFMAIFRSSLNEYLYWFIMSPLFRRMIDEVNTTTINQITQANLRSTIAPIPPLAEQERIVAKVGELMQLCDELAARQQAKRENLLRLNTAALAPLNKAASITPGEFEQANTRLADNFDTLYDSIDTVAKLRSTILQLAVQGKLVPQDPNEEPAQLSIRRILAEKEDFSKRKGRKGVAPKAIGIEQPPFDLPKGWTWARFGDVFLIIEAGWSPQCERQPAISGQWGVLKVSSVSWNHFDWRENKALPMSVTPRPDLEVHPGDFLISRANTSELVAKSVVVRETEPKLMISDKILRIRFPGDANRWFFNLFNDSQTAREYYSRTASGTSSSMKNISQEGIARLPVPVPPLGEQERIVTKFNQLMVLCDELETRIREAEAYGEKLMNASIQHVLRTATHVG